MMIDDLLRSIARSESAYLLYRTDQQYYQALRIKKANEEVYRLLNGFLYTCEQSHVNGVLSYLFHLEDWFHQFAVLEATGPALDELFVFNRLEGSPSFPTEFVNLLKNKKI